MASARVGSPPASAGWPTGERHAGVLVERFEREPRCCKVCCDAVDADAECRSRTRVPVEMCPATLASKHGAGRLLNGNATVLADYG